eukprot:Lankesteria_metandrocarpae@DN4052_c0_g1_i1.p1
MNINNSGTRLLWAPRSIALLAVVIMVLACKPSMGQPTAGKDEDFLLQYILPALQRGQTTQSAIIDSVQNQMAAEGVNRDLVNVNVIAKQTGIAVVVQTLMEECFALIFEG